MIDYKQYIDSVKDFPKEGILYRDIQPLLENSEIFSSAITDMGNKVPTPDYWVGIESRGFLFASALAIRFGGGVKVIRKSGKLPDKNNVLHSVEYELEYGYASIEMKPGRGNIVLVDDVYATGGTMSAADNLATNAGYNVTNKLCLLDIGLAKHHDVNCLITYNE